MVKERTKIIFLCICVFLQFFTVSKAHDLKFEVLNMDDIRVERISDLYQDDEGYIWIVSNNGLVRYDGHSYVSYMHGNHDAPLLSSLHTIISDKKNILYVGSERGIYKLNKLTGKYALVKNKNIERVNVSSMVKDSFGRIWIGTDSGLIMKSANSDEYTFKNLNFENTKLSDITSLMLDSEENLWITMWREGLFRYNLKTGEFYKYSNGSLSRAYTLYQDTNKNIWVGTWEKGLLCIKAEEIKEKLINGDSELHYEEWINDEKDGSSILDNTIYKISEDQKGNIWVGSCGGLSLLDYSDPKKGFLNYYSEGEDSSLPNNEVNCILKTRDNVMFIGTVSEIVCRVFDDEYELNTMSLSKVKSHFRTNSVHGLNYGDKNHFWLGVFGYGPVIYNSQTADFKDLLDFPAFKGYSGTYTVEEIIYAKDSTEICFASYNRGLLIYNLKTNNIRVINSTTSPNLKEDCLISLCEDRYNNIWIGTKKGVFILDKNDKLISLSTYINDVQGNHAYKAMDITIDKNDNVWIATAYNGVIQVDTKNKRIKKYYDERDKYSSSFISILAVPNSYSKEMTLWAGSSNNGLYRYNRNLDKFIHEDELVFLNSKGVTNLSTDSYGRIWATTMTSIFSFNETENDTFSKIRYWNLPEESYGFSINNNSSLFLKDDDLMAFGTTKGIITLPCSLQEKFVETKHNIALTNLMGDDSKLCLKEGQGEIDIHFSLFNYQNIGDDVYKYRLYRAGDDLSDVSWKIMCGSEGCAQIKDLPIGHWIFEVYGYRAGSNLNSNIASLSIEVKGNPWLSWWAILLYVLLGIGIIWVLLFSVYTYGKLKNHISEKKQSLSGENVPEENLSLEKKEENSDEIVFKIKDVDYTSTDKQFLQDAIDIISKHIANSEFNLNDFSNEMCVSRTVLNDKLKRLTGLTPISLIADVRMTTAYSICTSGQSDIRISDLAYSLGYNDPKYFSKRFKSKYGLSPKSAIDNAVKKEDISKQLYENEKLQGNDIPKQATLRTPKIIIPFTPSKFNS